MIGFPYPKYMNSNNDVDMTAAIIMCSVERARSLGVPEDRWVFPHSGADSHEHYFVSERITFTDTPAIRIGGQQALELAGVGIDDIEVVDLYSCFPSAVQLGAQSLGLALDRQLTRTGGLSFAGGPWNNYVMHAIATVVADLRERPGAHGFVWANGGYATTDRGLPSRRPASRDRRPAQAGRRRRRQRRGDHRGVQRDAHARGRAGDRARRVPAAVGRAHVGDGHRRRRRRRHV
jgi:acetyl-CoA C-acetyltransferase